MGFIWDLIQQGQISNQNNRTGSLEQRVQRLENELYETRVLLNKLMVKLEERFGEDIDGNCRIGY